MQKSQITYFFVLQLTYEQLELGLFANGHQISSNIIDKLNINQQLVITLETLLSSQNIAIGDIAYIAVNLQPAPITSLRLLLATVNGISYARRIPLLPLDGLRIFLEHEFDQKKQATLLLFNAYNQDCFYGLKLSDLSVTIGCAPIQEVLQQIGHLASVHVIGPGIVTFKELLRKHKNLIIEEQKTTLPLAFLAQLTFKQWQLGTERLYQLLPLYTKITQYKAIL